MMNKSPKSESKINSGGTRESLQPSIVAYGCCPLAKSARVSLHTVGKCAFPSMNRLFPSISLFSPTSADMSEPFVWRKVIACIFLEEQQSDGKSSEALRSAKAVYITSKRLCRC